MAYTPDKIEELQKQIDEMKTQLTLAASAIARRLEEIETQNEKLRLEVDTLKGQVRNMPFNMR
jgi:peptidoglycan hydrolase CwlO-like protein